MLTVFERLSREQLPFYLRLMQHLARRALPVPEPRADDSGELVHSLRGKPAALCTRLPGSTSTRPRKHTAPSSAACWPGCTRRQRIFRSRNPTCAASPGGRPRRRACGRFSTRDAAQLLDDEMAFQQQLAASAAYAGLPRAAVHADLFRDNVLFDGDGDEHLSGCVDFYFAGVDTLLFDLAVCVNDWCLTDDSGRIDDARAAALLAAYGAHRALSAAEHRLFPALLRAAALRFWLSRLADCHLPREAALLQPKDPRHFERLLRERVAQPWHPPR